MKQVQTHARKRKWAESRQAVIKGLPLSYPAPARERYQKSLEKLIAAMRKEYQAELKKILSELPPPTALDAAVVMDANLGSQARILLNFLASKWQKAFSTSAGSIVDRMIGQVDKASKANLTDSLKKLSGGLTIKTPDMPAALQDSLTASVAENVGLIKSVQAQYHERISGAVLRSIQSGGSGQQEVFDELQRIGGLSEDRAKLIASDQSKKITSQMNAERQKSVGIKKFQWLHSGKTSDPRKLHLELNGQIFSYDDLPIIDEKTGERGLPGQLIHCDCQAIPILDFGDGEDE